MCDTSGTKGLTERLLESILATTILRGNKEGILTREGSEKPENYTEWMVLLTDNHSWVSGN